ncbi:predicted protein [Pyrenophora tritici-repentis Pt-1C-BFP]|uniref:Uncharacterized protein n=1 Tax=Pyrenophora tritici-repentis (strain Pt-1C-BFP) TaxID=426418 RepID=B2WBP1_PYRTR|nr:uncharacterized protein PTRG_07054 [Pyrenophora tritici-repentis Pt-1C-BFP]EDU49973.1 predicted protein [Pyrenophora tritici-repentis Pt-1C-BFP]
MVPLLGKCGTLSTNHAAPHTIFFDKHARCMVASWACGACHTADFPSQSPDRDQPLHAQVRIYLLLALSSQSRNWGYAPFGSRAWLQKA